MSICRKVGRTTTRLKSEGKAELHYPSLSLSLLSTHHTSMAVQLTDVHKALAAFQMQWYSFGYRYSSRQMATGTRTKRKPANFFPFLDTFPLQLVPPLPAPLQAAGSVLLGEHPPAVAGPSSDVNEEGDDESDEENQSARGTDEALPSYPENCQYAVIRADVVRSLWDLYSDEEERISMRRRLQMVLLRVFYNNPTRHYTQGMNHLVGHLLFLMCTYCREEGTEEDEEHYIELVASMVQSLLHTLWAPMAQADLTAVAGLSYAMRAIVSSSNWRLRRMLNSPSIASMPMFSVSWMMTWFMGCGLKEVKTKMQLFVGFLVDDEEGMEVVYIGAALILKCAPALLELYRSVTADEALPAMYGYFQSLPSRAIHVNYDDLLTEGAKLQQRYPLRRLTQREVAAARRQYGELCPQYAIHVPLAIRLKRWLSYSAIVAVLVAVLSAYIARTPRLQQAALSLFIPAKLRLGQMFALNSGE